MREYPPTAVERAMKVQEVILRAMAKELPWCQAAEIIHRPSMYAPECLEFSLTA